MKGDRLAAKWPFPSVLWVPKSIPRFVIPHENSQDLADTGTHLQDLLQNRDTMHNNQKEKIGKDWRKAGTVFPEYLPSGALRIHLTPPATSCEIRVKCCIPAKLTRDYAWCFIGNCTYALSAWHIPKSKTPRMKADIQHKPYCLYEQCRHREPLLWRGSFTQCRELIPFKCPDTSQGSGSQRGLSEGGDLRPAMLTLFCTYSVCLITYTYAKYTSTFFSKMPLLILGWEM